MRRIVPYCALASVALFSCRSQERKQDEDMERSFATAFEILETRHGSGRTEYPESRLVDYESGITVRPDRTDLARLIGTTTGTDSTLSRSQIANLDEQIRSAEASLERLSELESIGAKIAEYAEMSAGYFAELELAGSRVIAEDTRYQDLLSKRKDLMTDLQELATIHVEEVVLRESVDWDLLPEDAGSPEARALMSAKAQRGEVYTTMVPNPGGTPHRFEADEVTRVLNATMKVFREKIAELESAVLAKAPKAEVEMEANLMRGGKPYAISISPYTIVEGADRGKKSPRVGIPSDEDLERVEKGFELNRDIAASLNGLRELARDDEALDELTETLLRELEVSLNTLVDNLLDQVRAASELADDALSRVKTAATALLQELEALERSVRKLGQSRDPSVLLSLSRALLDQVSNAGLKAKLDELKNSLDALTTETINGLEPTAKATVESLKTTAEAEVDRLAEALEGAPGGKDLATLVRSVFAVHELANSRAWGDLEPGTITRTPFSIETAQDGFVDLANSPAEPGDRLAVHYKITANPKAEPGKRREYRGSSWLEVRKFGIYTTLKSQLIFYDRLHDGSSAYRAAPALAYNVHYRPDRNYAFWDSINPGLGISVSTPSFDTGVDIAIGLQLTLFNDMLQTGYAYNISVDDDQEMFYFGLDLIGAFQKLP